MSAPLRTTAAVPVARLRPLASRPELLLRLAATSLAPALLREKAARCVLHLVRLLALSDPRTAVAGLLSPHRASAPDDRALAAARPAAALGSCANAGSLRFVLFFEISISLRNKIGDPFFLP